MPEETSKFRFYSEIALNKKLMEVYEFILKSLQVADGSKPLETIQMLFPFGTTGFLGINPKGRLYALESFDQINEIIEEDLSSIVSQECVREMKSSIDDFCSILNGVDLISASFVELHALIFSQDMHFSHSQSSNPLILKTFRALTKENIYSKFNEYELLALMSDYIDLREENNYQSHIEVTWPMEPDEIKELFRVLREKLNTLDSLLVMRDAELDH